MLNPVLIVGGYGVLGEQVARRLRSRQPDLELVIAGRDLFKANALASELGRARPLQLDLAEPASAQLSDSYSAIILLVKDEGASFSEYAGRIGAPLLSLSSALFEIGPEVFHSLRAASRAPVVLASHWFAGAAAIAAIDRAEGLALIDTVEVGLVIDRSDTPAGPATKADFERINTACPSTLVRREGRYAWVEGEAATAMFTREDGATAAGRIAVSCDVATIAAATDAEIVEVIEAYIPSLYSAGGRGAADEINIRITGTTGDGERCERRRFITAPRETSPLTAITTVFAIERLLGLAGTRPAPGVHAIDAILPGPLFLDELRRAGVQVTDN